MTRIAIPVSLVAAALVPVGLAATSPKALRDSSHAAALAQHSVHYVLRSRSPRWRTKVVADVARSRGIQRITARRKGVDARLTLIVVKRTVYLRGNVAALHAYLGSTFTLREARRYAHRWISTPHGEFSYAQFAADVTLGSVLFDHAPEGRLSLVKGVVNGRRAIGVRGAGVVQTRTVYVRSAVRPLPLEGTMVWPAQAFRERLMFSSWGEPIDVHAPVHAVSMAKVVGG